MSGFTCPYLGRADDRDTAFAFPSPGHRCFRLKEPSNITISHQSSYCLTDEFSRCPVFTFASMLEPEDNQPEQKSDEVRSNADAIGQDDQAISSSVIGNNKKGLANFLSSLQPVIGRVFKTSPDRNPVVVAILFTTVAILVIALLFFGVVMVSYFTAPPIEETPNLMLTAMAEEKQPDIFLITVTPTMRSAFIKKMGTAGSDLGYRKGSDDFPLPEQSPVTIIVTPTFQPSETASVTYACGAPSDWIPYTVQQGDSLSEMSVTYNVPLLELSSYNCLNADSSLFIGQQLYVPSS